MQHSKRSRATLEAMSRYPSLPLSLSANYEALADIDLSPKGSSWRDALKGVLASEQHQAFAAPPNDIDFAGLAANRLATQVSQQFTLASELVTILTGRFTDNPVVVNGTQSPAALLALDRAGFNELVAARERPQRRSFVHPQLGCTLSRCGCCQSDGPQHGRTPVIPRHQYGDRARSTGRACLGDARLHALRGALRPSDANRRH